MDGKYAVGRRSLAGTAVATLATWISAASITVAVAEEPSPTSLVVSAASDAAQLQPPRAVVPSQLVVSPAPEAAPPAIAPAAPPVLPPPRGDLTVVANAQRQQPLVAVDDAVVPATADGPLGTVGDWFSGGPRRPSASAGIQTRQNARIGDAASEHQDDRTPAPNEPAPAKPQPIANYPSVSAESAVQNALHRTEVSQHFTATVKAPAVDPAASLLLKAHELSMSAATQADYSQIVQLSGDAIRRGLAGENRAFAIQLSAWALNRRGQLRADENQIDLALADFKTAFEVDPTCWRALHNQAVTLAQRGQFAEAFDDTSRVIQLNPKFAKAYSNRATLYVQAGDFESAIADYDAALRIDHSLVAALVGRARVCHMRGRLDEALGNFNSAVATAPDDADIVCSRADLLADLGRYQDAMQDYARAIELNPKFEHAYRNGAWLLATCPEEKIRDSAGALKGAQKALECGYGERHAALDTLAAALANAGRFDEAIAAVDQAIEVAPEAAKPAYQARRDLYVSHEAFRTQPVQRVARAEYIEK